MNIRVASGLFAVMLPAGLHAAVSFTGTTISEAFDAISSTPNFGATAGTPTPLSGTIFDGGRVSGSGAVALQVNAGGTATGGIHSLGAASSTERALGSLLSGTFTPAFGVVITNNATTRIISATIAFRQENWRGSVAADRTDFAYATTASLTAASASLSNYLSGTAAFTDVNSLDLNGVAGTNAALDGNLPANQSLRTATITGLDVPVGDKIYFRFTDSDVASSDATLAIDDFSVSFVTATANLAPVVAIVPNAVTVDVSPDGLESFGAVTAAATDADGTVASFAAGAVPAQIADNIAITPGTLSNTFNIAGTNFTYADIGTYIINFTAVDNSGTSTTQSFTLTIVPEPVALSALALGTALLRRRRRP